jgi:hypothetical protein
MLADMQKDMAELKKLLGTTSIVASDTATPASPGPSQTCSIQGNNNHVTNVNMGVEVYNVEELREGDSETAKQFLNHINLDKIMEYVKGEPRKTIVDVFKDVFFNVKKKKNMILAVKDLEPLTIFLRKNHAWMQEEPEVLTELMAIILWHFRVAVESSGRKDDLGPCKNMNHLNVSDQMHDELARAAYDNTYKVVAAVGPLPD